MLQIIRARSSMSSFWSLGESGKRGVVLTVPLQRSEKAHRPPTALLFLHRRSFVKLLPSSPPPSLGVRSARNEELRALFNQFRLLSRINRGSRIKAKRRKPPLPGAMATTNPEELLLNGRPHLSRLWMLRQESERADPKARASCAPIRYLRMETLPFLASRIPFLCL